MLTEMLFFISSTVSGFANLPHIAAKPQKFGLIYSQSKFEICFVETTSINLECIFLIGY